MGLHLNTEFYAGRFDSDDGEFDSIVEITLKTPRDIRRKQSKSWGIEPSPVFRRALHSNRPP